MNQRNVEALSNLYVDPAYTEWIGRQLMERLANAA